MQRRSTLSGSTIELDPCKPAHPLALLEQRAPRVGKDAEMLEHRTFEHELLAEQLRMQRVRCEQMRRVYRAREIELPRFPVAAPVARPVLHILRRSEEHTS